MWNENWAQSRPTSSPQHKSQRRTKCDWTGGSTTTKPFPTAPLPPTQAEAVPNCFALPCRRGQAVPPRQSSLKANALRAERRSTPPPFPLLFHPTPPSPPLPLAVNAGRAQRRAGRRRARQGPPPRSGWGDTRPPAPAAASRHDATPPLREDRHPPGGPSEEEEEAAAPPRDRLRRLPPPAPARLPCPPFGAGRAGKARPPLVVTWA